MGWRTTAQNLNLNRDYVKAETPEMQAWHHFLTIGFQIFLLTRIPLTEQIISMY